ncbi:MAG: hypothetical protein A2X18_06440 [Bacteroidetes bacterium GWF2_40_14]|nr:MAG: hypothetical protein A2X18_06440 [Bacteroidetes bacterium GWF2_40_14]
MKRIFIFLTLLFVFIAGTSNAQTVSRKITDSFNPSTVRNLYEITIHVPLDEAKQLALAKLIEEEDAYFVNILRKEIYISIPSGNVLKKLHEENLRKVLNDEELDQYYRGICDDQAEAKAVEMREKTKVLLNTSYEEGKFVFASFYKIFLLSEVAKINYAGQPKILESEINRITEEELNVLREKCGISFDKNLNASRVWKFKTNTPYR